MSELIIGAIETYEDQRYGYKAGYEAYVMIKDHAWSERLSRYAAFLPDLQRGLPVPDAYRAESPGTDSISMPMTCSITAGHSNAGSKTIAVNLPNDEEVQLARGTRRLQLKKRDAGQIRCHPRTAGRHPDRRRSAPAYSVRCVFSGNTMFHEVAHGLGIKNTVDGSGTVREALREHASPHEEGQGRCARSVHGSRSCLSAARWRVS